MGKRKARKCRWAAQKAARVCVARAALMDTTELAASTASGSRLPGPSRDLPPAPWCLGEARPAGGAGLVGGAGLGAGLGRVDGTGLVRDWAGGRGLGGAGAMGGTGLVGRAGRGGAGGGAGVKGPGPNPPWLSNFGF